MGRKRIYFLFTILIGFLLMLYACSMILWSENYFNHKPLDEIKILEIIRHDCGKLCNTSRSGSKGPFFDYVEAPVDCGALFRNKYIDRGHGFPHAPTQIPEYMHNEFTMNNRLNVRLLYFNESNMDSKEIVWSADMIKQYINMAKKEELYGNYGFLDTNALRHGLQHAPKIKNGRVLVIGSEIPWVEACVLEAGAREVVTLDYARIISKHPQVNTLTPHDFRRLYLDNSLGVFDAIVTFSTVEHSGLGRYGDALNPWGDIITVAGAWCVTKTGGSLTIGVPYNYEHDSLSFNAHRIYGKIRYPYLATNWKQLHKGYGIQRVHVFIK